MWRAGNLDIAVVRLWAAALGIASLATTVVAAANPRRQPIQVEASKTESITFSRLALRVPESNEISVEAGSLRVRFIEALRSIGYRALGAESVVFDQDNSEKARLVLGGTVTELRCRPIGRRERRCGIGIVWELLDRESGQVTYRVLTRHGADGDEPARVADQLIWGAFYSLLARHKFVDRVRLRAVEQPTFAPAKIRRCSKGDAPMPSSAETIMAATVTVEAGDRLGSGTLISPEGHVLTAAHVVTERGTIRVQPRNAPKVEAALLRKHDGADVALLQMRTPAEVPCVPFRDGPVSVGDDLFAIGSPLAKELSFTLTRGVVSGLRQIDGMSLVQTDASINRGNSGGPLVDVNGRLVAVVSWKAAGVGVEGIAFGVPVGEALSRLQVAAGEATETAALTPLSTQPPGSLVVDDAADPVPALSDDSPSNPRPRTRKSKTASALSFAGWASAGVGAAGVGATYFAFKQKEDALTQDEFDGVRLLNDLSWVLVAAGAGLVVTSELLPREPLVERRARRVGISWSIGVGPRAANLGVKF